MKRFISFSGGVESTTACILYGKGATAIFCDAGNEESEMYDRLNYCEEKLKEIHSGDFTLIRLKPSVKVKGELMSKISEAALKWGFPSQTYRWCTKYFKIIPIDNFLKDAGDCELIIGFNADEEPGNDRTGNLMKCKNVKYSYNLYEDGHTRLDCERILIEHNLLPSFPVYMSRGGCHFCFFKTRKELKAKYIFDKEGFLKDEDYETELNAAYDRKKFYAINISAGTYKSIRNEVEAEINNWGLEQVKLFYKDISAKKPCGAFCHR